MARERLAMRKIREVLRLAEQGCPVREIVSATGVSAGSISSYTARAKAAGLTWVEASSLEDAEIEVRLEPVRPVGDLPDLEGDPPASPGRPEPDWEHVHAELRRKHVTRQLLWEEYRELHPDGYRRSQFFERYRRWSASLPIWMRQRHVGGEKLFIDFSGDGVPWYPHGSEPREAALFVSALGASQAIFACASETQRTVDWIRGVELAFEYFGGSTDAVVPDQARAVVKRSSRFDPEIQETFADFARHYATAVVPARPRKARDKAKVENAVLIAQRWIIARLRHRRFTSIAEINRAIVELLERVNSRTIRKLGQSRRELFERLDRPALKPLPEKRFEYADWKLDVRVGLDYHVRYGLRDYSVPFQLVGKRVDLRSSAHAVEIFRSQKRVASHARVDEIGRSTRPEHMPSAHRRHEHRSPADLVDRAKTIGRATTELVEAVLADRPHPEQGYRAALGILQLARRYPHERLEAACTRALLSGCLRYQSVEAILKNRLEFEALPGTPIESTTQLLADHENVRGPSYFSCN